MPKLLRVCALLVAATCLMLTQAASAVEGMHNNLVTTGWLKANLDNPEVLLFDASFGQVYKAKHIPGAVSFDVFAQLGLGQNETSPADVQRVFQTLGVSTGKKIVLYDQGGSWFAPRLFYSLEYSGFPVRNLYILDGGLSKWQKDGLPVTADATPAPVGGDFKIGKFDEGLRARLPEFVTASGDTENNVLLEALGANWHFGEFHMFPKAGHVPNAVLLPSDDYFNADKTFKSPQEIQTMLAYLSIKPEQQIYAHCGGGGAAAVPFFALRHVANYSRVKMYSESQMGWLSDNRDLPFWTYDAPYLMRETGWLQVWGGKALRSYGIARVSVVDVRPAAAFNQGHVPFAVNVPAEVFKDNIANPAKLAEILGASGVNPAYEAVVVSSAGVTRDSALAFLLLEKLGQSRVSVFMDAMDSIDSADKMAQRGFALTKDATVVGKSGGMAIPVTAYSAGERQNVLIADAASTHGVYPKVFVASGNGMPVKAPDGKVVHVPYTELLNADGSPKAAKDIWNVLAKAGVPRYAELVLISDDPGEAAANYFVLKLMGFPDVKVLLI
jgi:thiosulfate/3-mercaptopyruvate sulfurtransferase